MTVIPFRIPLRVYIEDTDAGGIVYYVNYLKFMERGRTEYFRALGYEKPAFITANLLIVVASVDIDYKRSAHLDDEILVTTEPILLAKSSLTVEQNIFRGEELLTAAAIKLACVNVNTKRATALPKDLYDTILPLVRGN